MDIREQIKQLNNIFSGTTELYRNWAKKHELSYNAFVVLYTLDGYDTCTQKQICEWWGLPKQTVHGILLEFEKKGLIRVKANEQNKRERLISFTEKGKELAVLVLSEIYKMEETAMKKLGEQKRKQLIACNREYYELLEEEMKHGSNIR